MNIQLLKKESILHDYEQLRLKNRLALQDREEEIDKKIPEIKQLRQSSRLSYIALAKKRLTDPGQTTQTGTANAAVSAQNRDNTARIRELLLMHGYPATYLDPIYDCPVCNDQGYIDGRMCECFKRRIVDSLYQQSNMSHVLDKENFDTFDLNYYSREASASRRWATAPYDNACNILQIAKDFVARFSTQETERGNLLLYGEPGLGKTFLTNCIAKSLLDSGHTVLYLSAIDIFEQIFGQYLINKKFELEELYNYIYNSELLIIDDLGTETTNTFVCSSLFAIINQRELDGKSTVISTNLSMQDLQERYSERIMSRIVESYTVLHLYGENIRYQKRKNEMMQGSKL